ncbi:MAG TPA: alcohol dehydrogenase catalytic domain-containing protein [Firmicutes bacterium]|jgi:threonine dehydrogenase-like Zn-dependent dehydrogenase|nr:alcohol dehydrogenase catalytic domain-containing protein [Bacillota bacterium]
MKSLAMVLTAFGRKLEAREIEIPPLEEGQILVKITAAGVCGSDVHMYKGNDPRTPLPMILGHEGVGEIVELRGKRFTVEGEELRAGDAILWNRGVSCGHCYFCAVAGTPALCPERWVYGITRPCTEWPYLNGCYAEYIILSADTDLFKLPPALDPAVVVPVSCSGATAAHCFDYIQPRIGDTVLIQGPGPVGIFATYFAALHGAKTIIMIGGTDRRLAIAKEFGVTHTLNRKTTSIEDRREIILQLTHGRGVDYAIEAVGTPAAVKEGVALVRTGGVYLSVGFGDPNGRVELDCFFDLGRKNLTYQGVWVSATRHTSIALQSVLKNPSLFATLVDRRLPLTEANLALDLMAQKETVKTVLLPAAGGDGSE